MTSGALIFAQNNSDIDYIKLAIFSAKRVNQFLDIPVTLITDNKKWLDTYYSDHNFDKVVEIASEPYTTRKHYDGTLSSKQVEWKNTTRYRAWDVTPYDKTLVLDADYILNSSALKIAFEKDHDFQIYRHSVDLSGWRNTDEFKRINQYSVPFYWATAFVFEKNIFTESFFNLVDYIKSEWKYFRMLYNVDNPIFRNDIAFSIAINIMNGKTNGEFAIDLPGKMFYTLDRDVLVDIDNTSMKFLIEKSGFLGEYFLSKTTGVDVHIMNKLSLSRFIDGEHLV